MPTVQLYGDRKVAPNALPGVRLTAAETPESEGAGLDLAQARQAETMGNVFGAGSQIATHVAQELANTSRKQADEVALLDADNQLSTWENKRLYDPQTGVRTVTGQAALGLPEQVIGEYDGVADGIAANLHTDEQRQAFARTRANRRQNLDGTLRRHTFEQMQAYEESTLKAYQTNKREEAISNATDPRRVDIAIKEAADAMTKSAPRLGWSPDVLKEQLEAHASATAVGVINRVLDQGNVDAAQMYFEHLGKGTPATATEDAKPGLDLIKGDALGELEKQLKAADTGVSGLHTATDIWSTLGPKTDSDPINLDRMEEAARVKFADKPRELESTLHFLRERKAGVDASRKDREEQDTGGLWSAVNQGATLEDLLKMPTYRAAPGKLQAQLGDYIISRAEHKANRAAAEEGRAYTAESRAYTQEQRGRAEMDRKGWGRYWDLSDPTILNATSEGKLESLRGEIGDEHVNRLMAQKRTLTKSDDAVRSATIDDDLFKTTAEQAGLHAYNPKGEDGKAQLGELKNAVETQIDIEQRAKGKLLNRDEKQKIMRDLTDRRVMLNQWFTDPERVAATVTNPDDRKAAYVPLAKVPAPALAEYLNIARSLSPTLQRMPDAELRVRFGPRIQRAYALRLLGASRDEIMNALNGKE